MKDRFEPIANRAVCAVCASALLVLGSFGCGGEWEDELEYGEAQRGLTAQVEQWRELVEKHLKREHVTWGLNIIKCESGGNPNAYNSSSGASGLFQHLKKYWADRASKAGFAGYSEFHPEANIAASAWLLYANGGGPQHWSCKHSPFSDTSYQPQFYDNGVPVGGGTTTPPPPAPSCDQLASAGGIIDDNSACFAKYGPSEYWRVVNGQGYGGSLHWTDATQRSSASNWAKWNINLASGGTYRVKYYAVTAFAMFSATNYKIHHGGQETTRIVNQSAGGTGWRTIGEFSFVAGGGQYIAVHDHTAQGVADGQHIIADAIKLERVTTSPPPPPTNPEPPPTNPEQPPTNPQQPPTNPQQPPTTPEPGAPAPEDPWGGQGQQPNPGYGGETEVIGGCAVAGTDVGDPTLALVLLIALLMRTRPRRR